MSRLHARCFVGLVTCAVAVVLGGFLLLGARIGRSVIADLPVPTAADVTPGARSILFYDRNGSLLYEAIDPNGNKNVPQPLDSIPLTCRQATIATEDSRFFSHPGVDPLAIGRAIVQDAWHIARGGESRFSFSGASTLTQQLARNLYLDPDERQERTLRRKLREAWLAGQLERAHSKDEVLELYLNTTYYGHFAVGIEAAAQSYFGVGARDLDLAQCALLAGLPQYPAGYNPIENPEAARERQRVVLDLMARENYISVRDAELAGREALAYAATPFPIEAPHFVMWVQGQLESVFDPARLRKGGLKVTTTLDLDRQRLAESIMQRRLQQLKPCAPGVSPIACDPAADPARRVDNAALVALEPASGAVLAMVGSPDFFDARINGAVNAALSLRQPGSAIKPLTYAAAFDPERTRAAGRQPWTPATLIADLRTAFPTDEGRPYVPLNYDWREHGPVTARSALANSYNIPAVKTLQHVGVDALLDLATRLGIPWREGGPPAPAETGEDAGPVQGSSRYGLALTLGGAEVRLLDLTAAYAAFANGGQRVRPHGILRVETLDGELLYDAAMDENLSPHRVLDPRVAFLVTDILSDRAARLPAFGQGNPLELDRPAAAKTGTTTDWRDNWTAGYTPELVAGIWVGNADNAPMKDVSGITGAGPIWHDFMLGALAGQEAQVFEAPDGVRQLEVCADSGLLPGPLSPADALAGIVPCPHRRLEWFIEGAEPGEVDRSHVKVKIDARTGRTAGPATPPEYVTSQTYWDLPVEYEPWARENGVPQPPREAAASPAWNPEAPATTGAPVALKSPDANRIYRLDRTLPPDLQQAPVTALLAPELANDDARVILSLNGAPFAELRGPDYTAWWRLAPGQHTFKAIVTTEDGDRFESAPVSVRVEQ
jgi:penicillin-binding protein 1C